jgi:hypothetical protein
LKGGTLSSNDDSQQTGDLLRSLNLNRRKKSLDERTQTSSSSSTDRLNLAKPLDLTGKKQKRAGEQTGQKAK